MEKKKKVELRDLYKIFGPDPASVLDQVRAGADKAKLLEETGRLEVVKGHRSDALGADYKLWLSDGHTPGLMLTEIPGDDGPLVFAADLIPGRAWMHLPITMGYDRYPERLIACGRFVHRRTIVLEHG